MTLITRTLVAYRAKDAFNKKRFFKLVNTCNGFSNKTRIPYIFDGRKYEKYTSEEDLLNAWKKMEEQYGEDGPAFILSTDKENPLFSLAPREDLYQVYNEDAAEFSFDVTRPLLKPGGQFSFNEFKEFFMAVINSYEAHCAYVHDNQLEELIVSGFTIQNMKTQVPEDLWPFIPLPEMASKIPIKIFESISNVIGPEQFDRLEIPEAIYWFNYWNEYQVENVGEDKIRTAPCDIVEKQKNGGYIIIVQRENFDASNISHLEKLASVYDHFNLYDLQQRSRFKD